MCTFNRWSYSLCSTVYVLLVQISNLSTFQARCYQFLADTHERKVGHSLQSWSYRLFMCSTESQSLFMFRVKNFKQPHVCHCNWYYNAAVSQLFHPQMYINIPLTLQVAVSFNDTQCSWTGCAVPNHQRLQSTVNDTWASFSQCGTREFIVVALLCLWTKSLFPL